MKVMHAYYVKESHIPSLVITPLSLMLSPMFNPQEFFLPEELLPPKKRGRDRSSSLTPTLPQELKIGESSCKTSLERHEEQIEEILNHLDELSLDRIKNMEDNIEGLGKEYISASSDYVSASPGKTYSSSSNNSFGLVPIASPTFSPFHDDPYMKVMHAYYVKESHIPSPVITPLSLMLSPMFNPQEFFLSEELLPPKKRGRDRSSSLTPTPPQELEIGESSCKTSLERHEEQIEEILNHLDELSLDRIKNMEDNIEGLGK
nr:hypothetical protein [Tanacetum cinerariifolium]